jgi:serine-type D-Ala-D-Ala carboxypeptidase (penicillin-binding protein 5/6)
MYRFLVNTCCLAVVLAAMAFGYAGPVRAQIETEAPYAFLIDEDTRTILFEKNADELMSPASMSKLMTLAVVFQALEDGKITLDSEMPVSEFAWRTGGAPSGTSAMFAPLNSKVKVSDLLQGVIVQSGNDACIILAEGLAGSEDAFAEQMNDYARRIGMKKSNFVNSTGLPHPKHLMTARELALLAMHIIEKFPKYYPYFQQKEFKYRTHMFYNRNPLIYANVGADGLKTGFTAESGYGVVGSAVQDGRRLVVVQNGVKSQAGRKDDATRLVNWGFKNFERFVLFKADEIVGEALVWGGGQRYVKLRGDGDVSLLLPKNAKQKKLHGEIVYLGPVKAPVDDGDRIGELRVTAEGGITTSAPLYAAESIEQAGVIKQGFDSLLHLAFGWLIHSGAPAE